MFLFILYLLFNFSKVIVILKLDVLFWRFLYVFSVVFRYFKFFDVLFCLDLIVFRNLLMLVLNFSIFVVLLWIFFIIFNICLNKIFVLLYFFLVSIFFVNLVYDLVIVCLMLFLCKGEMIFFFFFIIFMFFCFWYCFIFEFFNVIILILRCYLYNICEFIIFAVI